MTALMTVENLTLQFRTDEGLITAVDNVSFSWTKARSWAWSAKAGLASP